MSDEMFKPEPATKGETALVMFGLAGLAFLAGIVTMFDDDEKRYVEGQVTAAECRDYPTKGENGEPGRSLTACDVTIGYEVDGVRLELARHFRPGAGEWFTGIPEVGEPVRIDVTTDKHVRAEPGRDFAWLALWGAGAVLGALGLSQLRSKKR